MLDTCINLCTNIPIAIRKRSSTMQHTILPPSILTRINDEFTPVYDMDYNPNTLTVTITTPNRYPDGSRISVKAYFCSDTSTTDKPLFTLHCEGVARKARELNMDIRVYTYLNSAADKTRFSPLAIIAHSFGSDGGVYSANLSTIKDLYKQVEFLADCVKEAFDQSLNDEHLQHLATKAHKAA